MLPVPTCAAMAAVSAWNELLTPAAETDVGEDAAHSLAEAADLDEAGADGVPESDGDERDDENVAAEVSVDGADDAQKRFLHGFLFLLIFFFAKKAEPLRSGSGSGEKGRFGKKSEVRFFPLCPFA